MASGLPKLPPTTASADDALPLARALVDADADRLIETEPVSCRAGCSACCSQPVPVRPAEVRAIREHLAGQDEQTQADTTARIHDAVDRLRAAGVSGPPRDPAERRPMVKRYFEAGVPCPFLTEHGTCGIRPVRPLACREFLVTSDPRHCATYGSPVVRIRSSRDVLTGFGKVSRALGEPQVGWLAFEMTADPVPAPERGPASGVMIAQVLTGHRLRPEPSLDSRPEGA